MALKIFIAFLIVALSGNECWAFDWDWEGRVRAESFYIFDSPAGQKDLDSGLELRLGVLGNAWQGDGAQLDYEISANANWADGPSVQSGFRDESDIDFFRAWLRLEKGPFNVRAGRQKILFGAGTIFRPLGFFDTRNVTGVVPETRGVDGVRATYFFDATTSLEGWLVPGKLDDHLVAGVRAEALVLGHETGLTLQVHPETELDDLQDFEKDLLQLGFHVKGEQTLGYWNESRLDIERKPGDDPLRFNSVFGADYTFDIGEGLHVLAEYMFTAREKEFSTKDPSGDRNLHQFGILLDQPVGIDIVWRLFWVFDAGDGSFQVAPQIEYSLTDQIFLYLSGRYGGNIDGNDKTGRLFVQAPVFSGTESNVGLTVVAYF